MSYYENMIKSLGFHYIEIFSGLVSHLKHYRFLLLLLSLLFELIIVLLSIISIMLIHSLLTVGVETKSFEIGVMRMIGLTK